MEWGKLRDKEAADLYGEKIEEELQQNGEVEENWTEWQKAAELTVKTAEDIYERKSQDVGNG